MRTYIDCIPCFFKQALGASRLAGADPDQQREILEKVAAMVPRLSYEKSPPEHTQYMYRSIIEITGNDDPFDHIKRKSNELALAAYPELKQRVAGEDSLRAAVELAILGNIIDFGLRRSLDVGEELARIVDGRGSSAGGDRKPIFFYEEFVNALEVAEDVLYLGDNTGEVVFDRVLIEEILRRYPGKKVTYAVRERPIINDVLIRDARDCGIHLTARVLSSGSGAPGTILSMCTPEFRSLFRAADLIISKGQGNYETLSEEEGPIFFLFMAKCSVVARHLGVRLGDIILLDKSHK